MPLPIQTSPLFDKTLKKHADLRIVNQLKLFIEFKTNNPSEKFGAKDYPMVTKGPFGKVPALQHAALTQDHSIFYTVKGSVLRLYGIFTHKEAGIGNSPNIKTQKKLGSVMSRQEFTNHK